jgi:hypothetical protein
MKTIKNIINEELSSFIKEHTDWTGRWIPDESPFEKASEYSLQQDFYKELLRIVYKYQGKIKDQTISDTLNNITRKYQI